MDWARDSLGNIVHASQQGLSRHGLFCPNCEARVFRRDGKHNRTHFAHYGHSAKPECENFHPSSTASPLPLTPGFLTDKGNSASNPVIEGGLFLECTGHGNYSLYLKLPSFFVEKESCGEIKIQTGLGTRSYTNLQLERSRLVKVVPQLPLVDVIATGCLSRSAADINAYANCFRSVGNYFRARESGGKLLATEASLEWGEHYRLLTQQQIGLIPEIFGLRIEKDKGWEGWHLYDVVLPSFSDIQNQSETEILSRLLGRTIKSPTPTHISSIRRIT